MEKQFAHSAGAQTAKIGGLKSAANIMNYLDNTTETQLMDAIQAGQGNGSTDSRPHVRIREPGWCGRSFYSDLAA